MFEDVGKKIKVLAKVVTFILISGGLITGIVLKYWANYGAIGWLFILVAPLVGLIQGWFLYGFGEVIDKLSDIEKNTRGGEMKRKTQTIVDSNRISENGKSPSQELSILKEKYLNSMLSEEDYQKQLHESISRL